MTTADYAAARPSPSSTAALIREYDRPGPRYTSYPTAVEFNEGFDESAYRERLTRASANREEALSLYVHLPFCAERCTYCGCTMIATRSQAVISAYLEYLEREIAMLAGGLGDRRRIAQLHWGGGTPTALTVGQLERLHAAIASHFRIEPGAEQAIEVDPRVTSREQLQLLRSLGFNRLSFGVQDFDPDVQEAIGRRQGEAATRNLYEFARGIGFDSINVDLVYGLPRQTRAAFARTLGSIVDMRPDRIAVYSYAHVPWLRPHQKLIDAATLPDATLKLELIADTIDTFREAGYVAIGMDHFARPDDDLANASRERRLHRNFMGYTTRPASDLFGVGVSAIGDLCGAYAQNEKQLTRYYAAIDVGRFPTARGYALGADDLVRRYVITELMCNFRVDRAAIAQKFGIDWDDYFADEMAVLRRYDGPVADGFVRTTTAGLEVTEEGRLFVRTVCMVFDRYLQRHEGAPVFSRTI